MALASTGDAMKYIFVFIIVLLLVGGLAIASYMAEPTDNTYSASRTQVQRVQFPDAVCYTYREALVCFER